jgi:hypothetical protein
MARSGREQNGSFAAIDAEKLTFVDRAEESQTPV